MDDVGKSSASSRSLMVFTSPSNNTHLGLEKVLAQTTGCLQNLQTADHGLSAMILTMRSLPETRSSSLSTPECLVTSHEILVGCLDLRRTEQHGVHCLHLPHRRCGFRDESRCSHCHTGRRQEPLKELPPGHHACAARHALSSLPSRKKACCSDGVYAADTSSPSVMRRM